MSIKSFAKGAIASAVVAGASFGASAAIDTTTDLGAISFGPALEFGGFAKGAFQDLFTFSLPVNGGSVYSVVNFAPPGLTTRFNTLFSSIALFADPDGVPFSIDDVPLNSVSGVGPGSNALSMNWGATASGNMYMMVSGITTGPLGGIYEGKISVTPVPEPESYAMLLAGLGVMGAIAVRRKSKKQD